MARKVLILDTSILCVWLQIPGMDSIEKEGEPAITYGDVESKIALEVENSARIVLPLASIIECGNHITQIKSRKDTRVYVNRFADFIDKALEGTEPWDIFTNQQALFENIKMKELVDKWRQLALSGISMGDASIIQVAEFYDAHGYTTEIFTGDTGLKAYQPAPKPQILPRNKNRR